MKFKLLLLRIVLPLVIIIVDIKLLQHRFSNIPFALLLIALGYLMFSLIRTLIRRGNNTKYDRKPQSPWGALNEGIDPTL